MADNSKEILQLMSRQRSDRFGAWLTALRPKHWIKNVLVVVPLILAHKVTDTGGLLEAFHAFTSFSLCASGGYLVNDLLDIHADREHRTKRYRSLASGLVAIPVAVTSAVLLLAGSLLYAAWFLPFTFLLLLGTYLIGTVVYSKWMKRIVLLDIFVLTGLYTLRIFGGGVACNVMVSPWLLAFSMFIFLSLATLKRFAELKNSSHVGEEAIRGRGYYIGDLNMLRTAGITAGFLAVLVLALYINSKDVMELYRHPEWLWFICPVILYWIQRMWLLADRGKLDEDPLIFTLTDSASYVVAILTIVGIMIAT